MENNVKTERIKLGLTQSELAELVGTRQRAISYIELGQRQPPTGLAERIAMVFGWSIERMWYEFYATGNLQD